MPQNRLLYQVGIDARQAREGGRAASSAIAEVDKSAANAAGTVQRFGNAADRAGRQARELGSQQLSFGGVFDDFERGQQALDRLFGTAKRGAGAANDLSAATDRIGRSAAEARGAVDGAGNALDRFFGGAGKASAALRAAGGASARYSQSLKSTSDSTDEARAAVDRFITRIDGMSGAAGRAARAQGRLAASARGVRGGAQSAEQAVDRFVTWLKENETASGRAASANKRVSDSTRRMNQQLSASEQAAKDARNAMANWAVTARIVATQVAVSFVFQHLPETISQFVEFEHQMGVIAGLVGVNRDVLRGWEDDILAISRVSGQGLDELGESLFFITSAGQRGANALDILHQSALASAAGLGDQRDVVDLVTAAVNAYGEANLSAAEATDTLARAVELGRLAPDELASAAGRALPLASRLGVEFDEVLGILAAMSRTGTNAAEGVTQLSQIMVTLLKPTEDAEEALARIGDTASGLGLTFAQLREIAGDQGLFRVLEILSAAVEHQDDLTRIFPNIRATRGVADLLGPALNTNRQVIEGTADNAGKTLQAYNEISRTLRQETREFTSSLKAALFDLDSALYQTALGAMRVLGDNASVVAAVIKGLGVVVGALAGLLVHRLATALVTAAKASGVFFRSLGLWGNLLAVVGAVAAAYLIFRSRNDQLAVGIRQLALEYGVLEESADAARRAIQRQAEETGQSFALTKLQRDLDTAITQATAAAEELSEARAAVRESIERAAGGVFEVTDEQVEFALRSGSPELVEHYENAVATIRAIQAELSGQTDIDDAVAVQAASIDDLRQRLAALDASGRDVSQFTTRLDALSTTLTNNADAVDEVAEGLTALARDISRFEIPFERTQNFFERFEEAADTNRRLLAQAQQLVVAERALQTIRRRGEYFGQERVPAGDLAALDDVERAALRESRLRGLAEVYEATAAAAQTYLAAIRDVITGHEEQDAAAIAVRAQVAVANDEVERLAAAWEGISDALAEGPRLAAEEYRRFASGAELEVGRLGITIDVLARRFTREAFGTGALLDALQEARAEAEAVASSLEQVDAGEGLDQVVGRFAARAREFAGRITRTIAEGTPGALREALAEVEAIADEIDFTAARVDLSPDDAVFANALDRLLVIAQDAGVAIGAALADPILADITEALALAEARIIAAARRFADLRARGPDLATFGGLQERIAQSQLDIVLGSAAPTLDIRGSFNAAVAEFDELIAKAEEARAKVLAVSEQIALARRSGVDDSAIANLTLELTAAVRALDLVTGRLDDLETGAAGETAFDLYIDALEDWEPTFDVVKESVDEAQRYFRALQKAAQDLVRIWRQTRQLIANEIDAIVSTLLDATATTEDLLRQLALSILRIGVQLIENRANTGRFLLRRPADNPFESAPGLGPRTSGNRAIRITAPITVNVQGTDAGVAGLIEQAAPRLARQVEAGLVAGLQRPGAFRSAVRAVR